nr:hypothetical protein [Tanacetum cinerariifolium]
HIQLSSDDEDDGTVADIKNLDITIQVGPIPTTLIHKDHPLNQVIEDLQSATQTKKMSKNLEEHGFVSTIQQRTNHKHLQNYLFACFLSQEEPKKVKDLFGPTSVKSLMKKMYCLVVTDDYSKFTWVFFLATKDETSGILKSFITGIENLVDHKGILRQFSVARTPQQNIVAERKNSTLIKAARTMLADSKLPTTFWAEVVNTACYVQNKVLVDHLGKFDGKADEGFFVGYSLNSKAFRVFNSRTRIVEKNLHISFSESTPIVVGSGLDWLFDIDALTRTMNYEPIVAGTQSNGFAVAHMNNLDTTIQVSPILPTRIHKDHPLDQVIRDLQLATQTRKMSKNLEEHGNKKDENGIVIRNKARLVAQGYTQEEWINYDEVFAPVPRIEAIRIFLAYASFNDFVVYQMDVKSAFLYGKIEKEVYVCQPLGFEDPNFLDRVYKVEKGLYGLHHAPRAWSIIGSLMYLTSSRPDIMFAVCACARYQVNPKVSHLHVMKRIFSDYAGASLDRKTTTECCQFFGCRLISWQCKKKTVVVNSTTKVEYFWSTAMSKTLNGEVQLHAQVDGKEILITESFVRKDLQLADGEDEAVHKELGDSLVRATTTASSLKAEQDSEDTIAQTRFERVSKHSNDSLLARGNTLQSDEDSMKLDELMALCATLQNRVLDLEKTKIIQCNEIDSLKRRVKKLEKRNRSRIHKLKRLYKVGLSTRVESSRDEESLGKDASKQWRMIDVINSDEDITLVNDADNEMFDVDDLGGEEVFVARQNENVVEEVVDVAQVSTAITTVTITTKEITLAHALIPLKTSKPKIDADHQLAKRLQAQEQEELSDAKEATLFQQLLKKRRKHFAAKRVEEKKKQTTNKSSTEKDNVYLPKEHERIQAQRFKTRVGGKKRKEKRAVKELEQEITKKQKVDDAIPLAVKSPRIVD